jgi:hypothetical protein
LSGNRAEEGGRRRRLPQGSPSARRLNEAAASIVPPEAEFPRGQPGDGITVTGTLDIRVHGWRGAVDACENGCLRR